LYTTEFEKIVLDNGATIVFNHVPDSSLVSIQIRVLSGLSNEGEYAGTGVSHFLEHLLFKGTDNKEAEQIRKEIKSMGGFVNGSTGLDSAEYHITVPNENFEKAFDLLVNMVMQPVFTDEQMATEGEIILKEIKLNRDDPAKMRMNLLFAQAYRDNVYKYPVIGYEDTFTKLTRKDVLDYHAAAYTPDRMVVGITGGIDPRRALITAADKLNEYKRGRPWNVTVQEEPRQIDQRGVEFPAEVGLGYLAIGFHTTSVYSSDLYAADVLAILLGGGNDSRLYRRLVKEKELLYTISSVNYTPRYPGLFIVTGAGEPENMEAAKEEIFSVINELKAGKIKKEEVARAKTIVVSDYLRSHERIESINSSMTSSQLLVGDPGFFKRYVDKIQEVSADEINRMASKYLIADNSTKVAVLPEGFKKKTEEEAQREEVTAVGQEKSVTLDNGLKIIVKKRGQLPLVSITMAAPGGLRAETEKNNGVSNLTALVMLKGTKKRSENQIIPVIEEIGGRINAFSGMNSIGLSMSLMSQDLDAGLDVFEDVVKNSTFPEDQIEKQKKKVIAAIREQDTDIFENGMLYLLNELYGDHPYGMRILGEAQTVTPLKRKDILSFYEEHLVPAKAVLTVAGNVDVGYTMSVLTKKFSNWKGEGIGIKMQPVAPLEGIKEKDISMYKEQTLFLMGFQGVKITNKEKYALEVISAFLSGSDGLLFHAAREGEGLSYASGAVSVPQVDKGYFVLYIATTEDRLEEAEKTAQDVLKEVLNGQLPEEDIVAAKNRLISQHAHSLEANLPVSMTVTLDELYGLGADNYQKYPSQIRAVKKDDIVNVAKKIFNLGGYAVVIVHSGR
jgi:zinc protease